MTVLTSLDSGERFPQKWHCGRLLIFCLAVRDGGLDQYILMLEFALRVLVGLQESFLFSMHPATVPNGTPFAMDAPYATELGHHIWLHLPCCETERRARTI